MNLDRRQLLTYAIGLVGGSVAVTAIGGLVPETAEAVPATYFSAPRRALLDEVANLMIPVTDTPGALAAGVPKTIDKMMVRWASQETRALFGGVLDEINNEALAKHGVAFLALNANLRLAALTQYDETTLTGDLQSMMSAYARFKDLVATVYYLSEIGATQELRLEEVPGPFRGDIPLTEQGRAWAY